MIAPHTGHSPLLEASDLHISTKKAVLVDSVDFELSPGDRLGIIGESGSGKSLTALALLGLLPPGVHAKGSLKYAGRQLLGAREKTWQSVRGARIGMVFQEPMTALDPLMKVSRLLHTALQSAQTSRSDSSSEQAVSQLLDEVGLAEHLANRYPFELSGGQRQRVMIALAIAHNPDVLICDEPTTALDVIAQAQVLQLIDHLVESRGMALIFISHDLTVVERMSRQVIVMHDGQPVETGPTAEVLNTPRQPYTQRLLAATKETLPARPGLSDGAETSTETAAKPIIELRGLSHSFGDSVAISDINLAVPSGRRLGIVGGSGSGKSTLLKIIAGLIKPSSGAVSIRTDAHGAPASGVQMVFQDPQSSLNPRLKIATSLAEGGGSAQRITDVLAQAGLPVDTGDRFPHEFSGGQRQRISITRAVAGNPAVLLADEAVSALDVSIQSQVLRLLDSLVDAYGLTLIFVSHDLSVVRQICDEVVVMYEGRIVEHASVADLWQRPQHPYTRGLLEASGW